MKPFAHQALHVVRDVRASWKQLVLTDVACKALAFIVLTPLISVVFHLFIWRSGRTILVDEDILQFLLEPAGLACLLVTGVLTTAIWAWELAALMAIVCAAEHGRQLSVSNALQYAAGQAWAVVRLAARVVVFTLLAVTPFLAALGLVYWAFLTRFDINYYLAEKPPAFWIAVGCAAPIGLGMAAVLLRLTTNWFCALPLVCFEATPPRSALRVSRQRVQGRRGTVVLWVAMWLAITLLMSSLSTSVVLFAARILIPRAAGSLALLLLAVGTGLMVWSGLHLAINVFAMTSLAGVCYRGYRHLASPKELTVEQLLRAAGPSRGPASWITGKHLAVTAVGGSILAAGIGIVAVHSVSTTDHCEVIAHRGASGSAPENTMAAVRQAVDERTDWVEIDVQESADGEVVVFHDSDFMKLAHRDLNIWNATAAELKEIDIGGWFHADYRGERVPTLADVLNFCRGKCGVVIELKYYGHDQSLERRVVQIVDAHDTPSEIMIMSLRLQGIKKVRQLRPAWRVGLLTAVAASDVSGAPADFLAVNAGLATRSFIRDAHQQGKEVFVWTVDDPASMSMLIGRGVDGIITNQPALARRVLADRARLSSVERLLVTLANWVGVPSQIGEQ
jgi:glycerophosphoryl diester phosphodiesterase